MLEDPFMLRNIYLIRKRFKVDMKFLAEYDAIDVKNNFYD